MLSYIIKHAKASKVYLKSERMKNPLMVAYCGLPARQFSNTDNWTMIYSPRSCFSIFREVSVISQKHPTEVSDYLIRREIQTKCISCRRSKYMRCHVSIVAQPDVSLSQAKNGQEAIQPLEKRVSNMQLESK